MDMSFRRDFCFVFWFCDRDFTTASEPVFLFLHISGKYVVVGAIHESPVCLSDFTLATEISCQRQSLSVFLSRRKKNSEKERPLRGLRREVSPVLLRRTEMKSKAGAQCGSAPRAPQGTGATGSGSDGDGVHSGERFGIRGKRRLFGKPR